MERKKAFWRRRLYGNVPPFISVFVLTGDYNGSNDSVQTLALC
jgi:hypothetical protein